VSKNVLFFLALLIGIFIILSRFLSYTELLLTLGIVLLIVVLLAFLASDTIKNSFSGLALMISDPFSDGDRVRILNGTICDVLQQSLTFTQVKTLKDEIINVPNTELLKHEIVNLSRSEDFAFSVRVSVDHSIPHEKVEKLLTDAAEKTAGVSDGTEPKIFAEELRDNAIVYELLAYTNSPKGLLKIRSDLIYNIQDIFREGNVAISMPTHASR
ncbi:MAG: mechanosensitive ion channel, partial [Thermoplasmata archaeon]|nr:mechanosensitive ion channel [Thermoplasmata archaeon]